ncbi:hypothetical protein IAT38_005845 [Cryptococcus sp. DSM 104549]
MASFLGRPSDGDSPFAIGQRAMRDTSSPQPPTQRNPTPRGQAPPPQQQRYSPVGPGGGFGGPSPQPGQAQGRDPRAPSPLIMGPPNGAVGGRQMVSPPPRSPAGFSPGGYGQPPPRGYTSPPPQQGVPGQGYAPVHNGGGRGYQPGQQAPQHNGQQGQGYGGPRPGSAQAQYQQQGPPQQQQYGQPPQQQQAYGQALRQQQGPPPQQQQWQQQQQQQQPRSAAPVAPPAPAEDQELRMMFEQFDSSRSGQLSGYDLQKLLAKDATMDAREDCVKMLMNIFDTDRSGSINFHEFEGLYRYIQDWHGIFRRFDRDASGLIDRKELHSALLGFGFSLPPETIRKVEKRFAPPGQEGREGHGKGHGEGISFDRFLMACVTVKHYTEGFRKVDNRNEGRVTMDYNQFMEMVLNAPS